MNRVAWYSLFTGMHLLAAFIIVQVHQMYNEKFSIAARYTVNIYLTLSITKLFFFCSSFFVSRATLRPFYVLITDVLFLSMLSVLLYHVIRDFNVKRFSIRWRR